MRAAGLAASLAVAALTCGGCVSHGVPPVTVDASAPHGDGDVHPGLNAIDVRSSKYGAYLDRMVNAVQNEFDRLVDESKTYPPAGTHVVVKFMIASDGRVSRIIDVENKSTDLGARICVAAIVNCSPFGEWSPAMKAALDPNGEEMVFTFCYQ